MCCKLRNTSHMRKFRLRRALEDRGLKMASVARALNVNKSAVTRWVRGRVPAEKVLDVERVTGISRSQLRPDLYPPGDGASSGASVTETSGS